ncbi:MAG: heparinase II/III family protein [Candidatus Latescibacterota bacterium]
MSRLLLAAVLLSTLGPAGAPAILPEALPDLPREVHPGLLFCAADIPALRRRLDRAPYSAWWESVRQRARWVPASFSEERSKVRAAKSLAFAWCMTDSAAYAEQASQLLRSVRFPPRGGDLGEPHNEAEVAAMYALAYDWLHPFLQADPVALAEVRAVLAEEAERLYGGIRVSLGFLSVALHQTTHKDNWHLRVYAALGLAACALSDHPGLAGHAPQVWAQRAWEMVVGTLRYQTEGTGGGYAEGPFYLRYAADVYLPYLFVLRQRLGLDLFADPLVAGVHAWSLNLRLPSGRRPNIDDAHLDDFYGHYLAAVDPEGPVYRWDWESNSAGPYARSFSEMDAIVLYDDSVPAQPPDWGPSVFMPEAGDAVFRSSWSAEGTYLLLRGEHGAARSRGLAHEHPDETSFILYAGGEVLAVDGGYIDYTQHSRVNGAASHSLILVDGQGPPLTTLLGQVVGAGSDAFLRDAFASPAADYAQVETAYRGAAVRRRVLFAAHRYFVVADEVAGDSVRQYEWRLHGNGGGTSGGTYAQAGGLARWDRPGAELLAFLPVLPGRSFAQAEAVHSFGYLEELTHTVLRVQQQGQGAAFLAVLYPRPRDWREPVLGAPAALGGQAISVGLGDTLDVVWLASADSVAVSGIPGVRLVSDGRCGWVRWVGGTTQALCLQDGTYLRSAGQEVLAADGPLDLALAWSGEEAQGFARGSQAGYALALAAPRPVAAARHAGETVAARGRPGAVELALRGEGALLLQFGPEELAGGPADFDGSGSVDFADFFLFADAFGQPAAGALRRFDLDGSGSVDFADFFLFADAFAP